MTNTVYDKIGTGYNRTRCADPYIAGRLLALLQPSTGGSYLDIGCGTGNYTCRLADAGLAMTGVDPSAIMLAEARGKSSKVKWMNGTADSIPLASETMDGAIATLTIHHWPDLESGFKELYRVLKPGAGFVIFTFTPEQEKGYWFNHFFPEMMGRTFQKAINIPTITRAAAAAGFALTATEKYFVQPGLQDMFGYAGKHNPEIYFDPVIRSGISSFSLLASPQEVETGLRELRESIDNGTFNSIKEAYDNNDGDYLFIVLKKNA